MVPDCGLLEIWYEKVGKMAKIVRRAKADNIMRKDIRNNLKKITALVLTVAMTLSTNVSMYAEGTQIEIPVVSEIESEGVALCEIENSPVIEEASVVENSSVLEEPSVTEESSVITDASDALTPEEVIVEETAEVYDPEISICEAAIMEEDLVYIEEANAEVMTSSVSENSGPSTSTVDEVIDGVTHTVTYEDQGCGCHQAIACQVCTDNNNEPKYVHCNPGASTVPHYFDENRTCVGCGLTVAVDELDEALKEVDLTSDYDTRLREYLALKYSTYNTDSKTNVRGKQYLSLAELNSIPANIVIEIGNDTNAELKELTKYMVNFNSLVHLKNVKTIKIYGADIRFLYLPKQIETLVIQDSTFNLYRPMGIFTETENNASSEGTKSCTSLKNATLNNVTIGNHYKGTDRYIDNYFYHILNSTNLESFNINVKFTELGQRFVIDAGTTPFSRINSCTISNGTEGTGSIIIKSSNADSYFAQHFSQYIIEEANLESHFRTYLAYFTDIDSNHDKIVTQAELDAVTDLHITYKEALMSYMDAMNDLRDIAKFRHLKTLTIDVDLRRTGFHIDNIAFPTKDESDPDTGKLESITINNLATKLATDLIEIPASVKKFEYTDNFSIYDSKAACFKISDSGSLEKVILDRSSVKNLEINNTSGNKRVLGQLSASECSKLEQITLGGSGYVLSGSVMLNDCGNLTKIGKANINETTKWTMYLAEGALLNISNCAKFGADTENIEINTASKTASIWAYGVNGLSNDHKLSINENATGQSTIMLRYDGDNAWWSSFATSIGATSEKGSTVPNIAVFAAGNHLRDTAKADATTSYDRWIDRYEVEVLRKSEPQGNGGSPVPASVTDQEFSTFEFYVEEEFGGNYVIRKVTVSEDSIEIISTNEDIVKCTTTGFDTHSPGRVSLEVYWKNGDGPNTKIGQEDILVQNFANDIDLKLNNSLEEGSGSIEKPIYVEKNTGKLTLTAQVKYEGGYLPKEVSDVLWRFMNGSSGKEISSSDTTKQGIKVVSDTFSDPTDTSTDTYTSGDGKVTKVLSNTRTFSFSGALDKYYAVAQVPYNRIYGYSGDDNCIRKSFYVELTGPCQIAKSSTSLVQGSGGSGSVNITLTGCKNYDVTIKDASKYNDLLKVDKDTSASNAERSVWTLRTNGSDYSAIKNMINSEKSVTLLVNADYGIHEVTFNMSSSWSSSSPSPTPTPTPTPEPTPVEPVKDPETPTTGEPVKDEKTGGDYVIPDPTKNEVVYKAPPADETKKTVTIPDTIVVDGKKMEVVKIDPGAFKNNDTVKTINVGKNIETIGAGAFEGASNLTKVTLGKNVETIGDGAFKDCTSLKSVSVPAKTTEIGDGAFEGCKSLTSVKLGSAVKEIGDGAFKDCTSLKKVSVPAKTTEIGDGAFEGCKKLSSVSLGKSVTEIGDGAFKNCTSLKSVTIPSKTKKIGDGAFEGDKKLTKVSIGKNVEEIGDGAFKDCKSLTSLSLPSKAAKIGSGAFEGCSKLTTLKISSKKLTSDSIDAGAFSGLTKKTTIKVPKSKLKEYKALFKEKGIDPNVKIKGY